MTGPDDVDLSAVLRAARRRADLSQRELALRSGVAQSCIARIESGAVTDPSFRTVERLLRSAGSELDVVAREEHPGVATPPDVPQEWRDRAGRLSPAHLDVRPLLRPESWWGAWWASSLVRDQWPVETLPEMTFRRVRAVRDRQRARLSRGMAASIDRVTRLVDQRTGGSYAPGGEAGGGEAGGGEAGGGEAGGGIREWAWTARLVDGAVVGELRAHEFDDVIDGVAAFPLITVPRGTVVLDGVVVAPAWRRLGIGRRLVGALRAEVGTAVVTLAVGGEPRAFLWACGFEPTRSLDRPEWLVSRATGG